MTLTPYHDPATGAYWCALACPLPYRTEAAAAACDHHLPPVPYVPGEPDVRRPSYVPAAAKRAPSGPTTYRPRRRRGLVLLLGLLLALVLVLSAAVVALGAYADTHPRGPVVTPTTYGVPLPRGGCCTEVDA
jgi:hypothetical protein